MGLEILNNLLASFLENEEFIEEDYSLVKEFANMIVSARFPLGNSKYHIRIPLNKSIHYSLDFMSKLNKKYGEILEEIMKNKTMEFEYVNSKNKILSRYIFNDEEQKIKIYVRSNLEDTYTISHETMHYINTNPSNLTSNWDYMCEVFSILTEKLQQDYFGSLPNGPKEYMNNERDTLFALYVNACQLDFIIKLIFEYEHKKEINEYDIFYLVGKNPYYAEYATHNIIKCMEENELNFYTLQRYVIGGILSTHMYERIHNDKKKISEFIELNDFVTKMSFIDTLKYLDLEVIDEDAVILSPESNKLLRMQYEKRTKNC